MSTEDRLEIVGSTRKELIGSMLRAGLATAPFAGGLASAWADYNGQKQASRIEEFMNNLEDRLRRLEGETVELSLEIQSLPDIAEVMDRCIEASTREANLDKRKIFADAYFSFITKPSETTEEDRVNIVLLLEQLTMRDLDLLRKFASSRHALGGDYLTNTTGGIEKPIPGGPPEHIRNFNAIPPDVWFMREYESVMHSVVKLETRGLITEVFRSSGFVTKTDESSQANQFRRKCWVCTPTGSKTIRTLC